MFLYNLREPVNAWSHGAGMLLAVPITWMLWQRCGKLSPCDIMKRCRALKNCTVGGHPCLAARYQRFKALSLLVFGASLIFCYAASATFHAVLLQGDSLGWYQRLDHIGIYMLIAGTYTPVAWSLLRGKWFWGTLTTVWTIAVLCSMRIWYGGVLPIWISTLVYLAMGWGSLLCYRELARTYSHRTLLPLPLGGVFYSVGALINLARWPVLMPGVFAAHELFHFFVIAGSVSHIMFMLDVVIPAQGPMPTAVPARSRPRGALLLRWLRFVASQRTRRWMLQMFPHPQWLERMLVAGDQLDPTSSENTITVA